MAILGSTRSQNVVVSTLPSQTYRPLDAAGNVLPALFMLLKFSGPLQGNDQMQVALNNGDTDTFKQANGTTFWSRPIKGNSTQITIQGTSRVLVSEVALCTGMDFMLSNGTLPNIPLSDADPWGWNSNYGGTDNGPAWESVDAPTLTQTERDVANRVGLFVYVSDLNGVRQPRFCTAALVGSRQILTAAHCIWSAGFIEADSGSFCLNYQAPAPAQVRFYKVRKLIKTGFRTQSPLTRSVCDQEGVDPPDASETPLLPPHLDYAMIELMEDVLPVGFTPLQFDTSPLTVGNEVFIIHHPGGRPKKISRRRVSLEDCQVVSASSPYFVHYDCDCDKGSSGSPVFNQAGQIIGVETEIFPNVSPNRGPHARAISQHFQNPAFDPAITARFGVVVDTSGSMGMPGESGLSKMVEAQEAVDAFVGLLRTTPPPGQTQLHRLAIIGFSTQASVRYPLTPFDGAAQNAVRTGIIGTLVQGGMTAIGQGVDLANATISPGTPAGVIKSILLMTDGVQNIRPWVQDVVRTFGNDVQINIVGFGKAELDGALLGQIARDHCGSYTHAYNGLTLKKYFAAIYSNVFETGMAFDPVDEIPAGSSQLAPIPLPVFGETLITVVLGWEHFDADLTVSLHTPTGRLITSSTPGVDAMRGHTWAYLRLELPFDGEQNGPWEVLIERQGKQPLRFYGHSAEVSAVAFDPSGKRALSGARDGVILYWDLGTGKPIRRVRYAGAPAPVTGIAVDRRGTVGIAALEDGRVIVFDLASGQVTQTFVKQKADLTSLAYYAESGLIAVGDLNGGVSIWDLASGSLQGEYLADSAVLSLTFTRGGGELLAGFRSGPPMTGAALIDTKAGTVLQQYNLDGDVRSLSLSRSEDLFAVAVGRRVVVCDTRSGKIVQEMPHDTTVNSVAFVPDDQHILSGTAKGDKLPDLILWNLSGKPEYSLVGHEDSVLAVAVSQDGLLGLSASADQTIMLWDLRNGKQVLGPLDVAERLFVSALVTSDIFLIPRGNVGRIQHYTGDALIPQVIIRNHDGTHVPAHVELEIEGPADSIGNILQKRGLLSESANVTYDGDVLTPAAAALAQYQDEAGGTLISTVRNTISLYDDGAHYDGAMEPDGIFGNLIDGMTKHEGHYTLRARAHFGPNYTGSRETTWSVYVDLGIDAKATQATTTTNTLYTRPDGKQVVSVVFTPLDGNGNYLGPGRSHLLQIAGYNGQLDGGLRDLGNGAYAQNLVWDPSTGQPPAISIAQPDRPIVLLGGPASKPTDTPPSDQRTTPRKRGTCSLTALIGLAVMAILRLLSRRNGGSSGGHRG